MEDESAIPVLEDEAIQFECLLVEPQDDHVSVDAFLCFHRNSPEKCMEMEDIPCKFGGDDFGTNPEQKHLLGQERGLDIKHSEIEAENFLAPNDPSSVCEDYLLDADFGESGKKLDHDSSIELQKLVSGSHDPVNNAGDNENCHNSDSSGPTALNKCLGDPDMNDSTSHDIFSCTADSEMSLEERWFKYPTFTVENMEEDVSSLFSESNNKTMGCTHNVASAEVLCPLTANQETKHISMGENKNVSLLGKDASPSKSPIQANIVTHAEKRLRKPPQRFIDELSEPKSKPHKRREVSTPSSKGKFPRVGSHKHCDIKSKTERLSSEESAGKAIQVPFGPIVQKESQTSCALPSVQKESRTSCALPSVQKESRTSCALPLVQRESRTSYALPLVQKQSRTSRAPILAKVLQLDKKPLIQSHKQALVPRHEEAVLQPQKEAVSQPQKEASVDESEEDDIAEVKLGEDGGRRKHHILWTVSEVKKLIDGVSKYGVGRWSRIKKDLFPSSAHRTPVDLKDKWRNLLKASCAQREGKKGEDRKRNLAWRPLPKTILRRVSELATLHPYPRDLRSKR